MFCKDSTQNFTALDSKAISKLKSVGFIGVNIGGGMVANASVSCAGSCKFNGQNTNGSVESDFNLWHLNVGILGGYTHFFIPFVGIRAYGGFDYGYLLAIY